MCAAMHIHLHINFHYGHISTKMGTWYQLLVKLPSVKFHENLVFSMLLHAEKERETGALANCHYAYIKNEVHKLTWMTKITGHKLEWADSWNKNLWGISRIHITTENKNSESRQRWKNSQEQGHGRVLGIHTTSDPTQHNASLFFKHFHDWQQANIITKFFF